jgi:hypothetical protein
MLLCPNGFETQLKPVQQSRQQALRAYCPNIITVIQGPELPFTISQHGMVKISENAIYIIGGRQDDAISQDVWIIDPKDQYSVKKGPSLKTSRLVLTGLWKL